MEPYEEADYREAVWDMKCAKAPRCKYCHGSVYPHEIYMELPEGEVICEECIDSMTHDVSDLEDLW